MIFKAWRLRRRFDEAVRLEQAGRLADARARYLELAEAASGDAKAEAFGRAGACATRMGDLAVARKYFQSARDAAPTSPDHWLNYANSLHRLGDGMGADEAYVEALKLAPDRPDILYYQSVYYADKLTKAGLEGAKRAMRKLVEMLETTGGPERLARLGFPRELPLIYLRNLALEKQLIEEGLAGLDEFVKRPSNHESTFWVRPAALNHKGLLLANVGRYDEAVLTYREALAIRPSDDAIFNLGMAQVRRHQWEEARGHFSTYGKKHPTSPVTTFGLAMLSETKGEAAEAVRLYSFFLKRHAQAPVPIADLATLDLARSWVDHAKTFTEALSRPSEGGVFEVGDGPEPEGTSGEISDRPRGA